jgi:hypothetical protein
MLVVVFRGRMHLISCYSEGCGRKQFSRKGRRKPLVWSEIISEINSEEKLSRLPVLLAQTKMIYKDCSTKQIYIMERAYNKGKS